MSLYVSAFDYTVTGGASDGNCLTDSFGRRILEQR